jgi:hypothetical protein
MDDDDEIINNDTNHPIKVPKLKEPKKAKARVLLLFSVRNVRSVWKNNLPRLYKRNVGQLLQVKEAVGSGVWRTRRAPCPTYSR